MSSKFFSSTEQRHVLSYALMIVGVGLIGWAGWMFYGHQQSYQLLNDPSFAPPAEETGLTVSLAAPTPTPESPDALLAAFAEPDYPFAGARLTPTPAPVTPTGRLLTATLSQPPSLADNPLPVYKQEEEPLPAPDKTTRTLMFAQQAISPPTRLVIPAIEVDSPVIEVGWQQVWQQGQQISVWQVADYAAGWHQNSTLPGHGGNVVLSGHHNINGEIFRHLVDLEPGNRVELFVEGEPYYYLITDKFILKDKDVTDEVRRTNARWIGPFNEERLTLITCWPYHTNTHRLIVVAKPDPDRLEG